MKAQGLTACPRCGGDLDPARQVERSVREGTDVALVKIVADVCNSFMTRPYIGVDTISDWSYIVSMKTLAAAKFKEQCLSILDHLEAEGLVITKHGKPVARILPAGRASADLIGAFRGRIRVKGDIQSTGVTWEAHG
jgi:antitoxin (DNA-binding transcriptional repressor) of toxin-antitoxin stability system